MTRSSRWDGYVHEFKGRWYVCLWDDRGCQMRYPCKSGGEWVASGYSESAALYVNARSYPTRRQALRHARDVWPTGHGSV